MVPSPVRSPKAKIKGLNSKGLTLVHSNSLNKNSSKLTNYLSSHNSISRICSCCSCCFNCDISTCLCRLFLIILSITAIVFLIIFWREASNAFVDCLQFISELGPFYGAIALTLANIVGALLFLPCVPFTLGAGYIYGTVVGSAIVSLASTLAACLAFIVARYFARKFIDNYFANKANSLSTFKLIDKAIAEDGFRIVFLIRSSPLHPYGIMNYLFGITSVSLKDYAMASFIAMMPTTIMEVYVGTAMKNINDIISGDVEQSLASRLLFWFGLGITIVVTIIITVWVRRRLKNELQKYEKLQQDDTEEISHSPNSNNSHLINNGNLQIVNPVVKKIQQVQDVNHDINDHDDHDLVISNNNYYMNTMDHEIVDNIEITNNVMTSRLSSQSPGCSPGPSGSGSGSGSGIGIGIGIGIGSGSSRSFSSNSSNHIPSRSHNIVNPSININPANINNINVSSHNVLNKTNESSDLQVITSLPSDNSNSNTLNNMQNNNHSSNNGSSSKKYFTRGLGVEFVYDKEFFNNSTNHHTIHNINNLDSDNSHNHEEHTAGQIHSSDYEDNRTNIYNSSFNEQEPERTRLISVKRL